MANGAQAAAEDAGICEDVQLTPLQCNAVIEEKLTHLQPVMECALVEIQRLRDGLANGEISWRSLLKRAIKKHEESTK